MKWDQIKEAFDEIHDKIESIEKTNVSTMRVPKRRNRIIKATEYSLGTKLNRKKLWEETYDENGRPS